MRTSLQPSQALAAGKGGRSIRTQLRIGVGCSTMDGLPIVSHPVRPSAIWSPNSKWNWHMLVQDIADYDAMLLGLRKRGVPKTDFPRRSY